VPEPEPEDARPAGDAYGPRGSSSAASSSRVYDADGQQRRGRLHTSAVFRPLAETTLEAHTCEDAIAEFERFLSSSDVPMGTSESGHITTVTGFGSRLDDGSEHPFVDKTIATLQANKTTVVAFDGDWLKDDSFTRAVGGFLASDESHRAVGFRKASGNKTKMVESWTSYHSQMGLVLVGDKLVQDCVRELERLGTSSKDSTEAVLGWLTTRVSVCEDIISVGGGGQAVTVAKAWLSRRTRHTATEESHRFPRWQVLDIARRLGQDKVGWERPTKLVSTLKQFGAPYTVPEEALQQVKARREARQSRRAVLEQRTS
jgi:hypothetical protein